MKPEISTTGWVGLILIAAAAVWYWLGWLLLRAHAADTASPRDALLLGKVEGDERRYVPLGADLYGSKKEFLRVNSLLGKNEKQVYDEFIATGKWKELVADPGAFRFLSFH